MIKFIPEKKETQEPPKFSSVESDQFFVNSHGWLCQKQTETSFNTIARFDGVPFCSRHTDVSKDLEIKKILPRITKIEF